MATSSDQAAAQKARYVVLGDTKDIICKKTTFHSVLGQTIDHLTCHVRQYQGPAKPTPEWRKQVVLSKYQACGTDANFTTTNKAPIQCLNYGGKSFQSVISTMNQYVHRVHKCLERYINKKLIPSSSSLHLPPPALAVDVEEFLHESGLVVNECIPTTLKEIEKNKQLKSLSEHAAAGGEPLRPPKSKSDMFWTCITSFSHRQTNENLLDEMYGRLVRTHRWGHKNTNLMQWWGVECLMHRWSNDNCRIATPTQILTLTPTETLCLLTYITEPYTSHGTKHNCLKIHWPDLLNDTVTNCLKAHTDQGASSSDSSKLKAHLSEGDDATIYLHTTTGDGSPPEMMLTDFATLVEISQKQSSSSPMRRPAITLPPNYVPPGQPPNAPVRKNSKRTAATSFIVKSSSSSSSDEEDDEDILPLRKYVAATKRRKQGQDQNDGAAHAPPPQKRQKTTSSTPTSTTTQNKKKTAAASKKKSSQIMKEWKDKEEEDNGATPPPSDNNDDTDDGLVVLEGECYIRKGGFTDDENATEDYIIPPYLPSQMDKIVT